MTVEDAVPDQAALEWDSWAKSELLQPLIGQAILFGLFFIPSKTVELWKPCVDRLRFVRHWLGTRSRAPERYGFLICVWVVNFLTAILGVVLWTREAYRQESSTEPRALRLTVALTFLATHLLRSFIGGFRLSSLFNPYRVVDILCIMPALELFYKPTWLSWRYLRVVSAVESFSEIDRAGALKGLQVSEFTKALFVILFKLAALVFVCAGATFTLEVLGPLPDAEDKFFITGSGAEISPLQMVYFTITTLSTVGYGDFSPTTGLSRMLILVVMMIGVSLFGVATGEMIQLKAEHDTGRDSKGLPTKDHVVIMGGGIKQYNSLVVSLLGQLYSADEIAFKTVLMTAQYKDADLMKALTQGVPAGKRSRVMYFAGSPMVVNDLKRVHIKSARMVLIVANPYARDPKREDSENLMRALAVKEAGRDSPLRIRLVLLNPEAHTWAVTAGIPEEEVISVTELKVNMLAQCCRCHGYSTLIMLLLRADPVKASDQQIESSSAQQWQADLLKGANRFIQGCFLPDEYAGETWSNVTVKFFEEQGVMLVAVQIDGKLFINPAGRTSWPPTSGRSDCGVAEKGDIVLFVGVRKQWANTRDWIREYHLRKRFSIATRSNANAIEFLNNDVGAHQLGMRDDPETSYQVANMEAARRDRSSIEIMNEHNAVLSKMNPMEKYKLLEDFGGHILVIVVADPQEYPSNIITSFIRPLRSHPARWEARPLIFLTEAAPPEWIKIGYPDVVFLSCDIQSVRNLQHLQLQEGKLTEVVILVAKQLARYSTDMYPHETTCFQDGPCTVVSHLLEVLLEGAQNSTAFMLYELVSARSAALLGRSPMDAGTTKDDDVPRDESSAQWSRLLPGKADGTDDESEEEIYSEFFNLPGFAEGRLFTVDFIGQMLATEVTFPATLEFTESMIMPFRRQQQSSTYLVRVPEDVEEKAMTYGDLVKLWAGAGATLLGIYRIINDIGETAHRGGRNRIRSLTLQLRKLHTLHSRHAKRKIIRGGAHRCVLACPDPHLQLHKEDQAYVLAHPDWAKARVPLQQLDSDGGPKWRSHLHEVVSEVAAI